MDRIEKKPNPSPFGNEAELGPGDEALLETPGGRENDAGVPHEGSIAEDEIHSIPIGAHSRREVTDTNDAGDLDRGNDTDGLDATEEAVREAAEDIPTGINPRADGLWSKR